VEAHVQDALAKGATASVGGERVSSLGDNFYAPTVLTGATEETLLSRRSSPREERARRSRPWDCFGSVL